MEAPLVEARPAATVMLIRDSRKGIEVLMVRRLPRGFFGGLTVFPGGAVEVVDASELAGDVVPGNHADQEFRVAALRELAEEAGLALTIEGVVSAPNGRGEGLLSTMRAAGISLDASALTLVSRWVTPVEAPTRYDTRFYLAIATDTPDVRIDGDELVEHLWVAPGHALVMHADGGLEMFLPTIAHLRWLERRSTVHDAVTAAEGAEGRSLVEPRRMEDGSFQPIHLPADD
ncbi:MAG TPA: NUDIX domain-containing protein [Acidimicrobiia bacterium]|nr:NUDIX domain-containing protein [Acidimicrobiia bacterium]